MTRVWGGRRSVDDSSSGCGGKVDEDERGEGRVMRSTPFHFFRDSQHLLSCKQDLRLQIPPSPKNNFAVKIIIINK